MGDAIWSTPPGKMLDYPAATFLRFCDNHGLLHITGKPMWMSVIGGSRVYVEAASRSFSGEVYTAEPVERVERTATGARVHTASRARDYDAVMLAAHAPQALELLGDSATPAESARLSAPSPTSRTRGRCTPTRRSCPRSGAPGPHGTGTRSPAM